MSGARANTRGLDAAVAAALLAAAVVFLSSLPHDLGAADESIHLYQAKRLLHGDVMYRDLWNAITPGFMYVMALLFRVFGTTIATARVSTAVMHGLSMAFLYLACRRLRVRPVLAWLPALAYLLLAPPAWAIASQHWLATTLSVVLLWVLATDAREAAVWAFRPGFVAGLIIAVTQQRGLPTAFGVFVWLLLDHAVQRRFARPRPPLLHQVGWLVAGGLAVGIPLCAWMIASAGFRPVWDSLIAFPMNNYGQIAECPWGYSGIMTLRQARLTYPTVLKYLPLVLLLSAARLALSLLRRGDRRAASGLILLVAIGVTSIFTIWYFPDFIHIAFITPVFLAAIAENLEWGLGFAPPLPRRSGRAVATLFCAALLVLAWLRLSGVAATLRAASPYERDTAFGHVALASENDARIYDRMAELLRGAPGRTLFVYPTTANQYLMLDARDPISYGFLVPSFNPPEHTRTALRQLAEVRPPYVVLLSRWLPVRADDPIAAWIQEHYRPIEMEQPIDEVILRPRPAAES